jgi:hypothetical protein
MGISLKNLNSGSDAYSDLYIVNDNNVGNKGLSLWLNSSGFSNGDGSANTGTLRNDVGDLRLTASGNSPLIYLKTSSGNVGIGTTNPIGNLDVENSSNTATICLNGSCELHAKPTLGPPDYYVTTTHNPSPDYNPVVCGNPAASTVCSAVTTTKNYDLCVLAVTEVSGNNNNCVVSGTPSSTWKVEADELTGRTNCQMNCYQFQ